MMFMCLTDLRFSLMVKYAALAAITMLRTVIVYFEKNSSTEAKVFNPDCLSQGDINHFVTLLKYKLTQRFFSDRCRKTVSPRRSRDPRQACLLCSLCWRGALDYEQHIPPAPQNRKQWEGERRKEDKGRMSTCHEGIHIVTVTGVSSVQLVLIIVKTKT